MFVNCMFIYVLIGLWVVYGFYWLWCLESYVRMLVLVLVGKMELWYYFCLIYVKWVVKRYVKEIVNFDINMYKNIYRK